LRGGKTVFTVFLAGKKPRFRTSEGNLRCEFGRIYVKRGRRESNPQPPDRQSRRKLHLFRPFPNVSWVFYQSTGLSQTYSCVRKNPNEYAVVGRSAETQNGKYRSGKKRECEQYAGLCSLQDQYALAIPTVGPPCPVAASRPPWPPRWSKLAVRIRFNHPTGFDESRQRHLPVGPLPDCCPTIAPGTPRGRSATGLSAVPLRCDIHATAGLNRRLPPSQANRIPDEPEPHKAVREGGLSCCEDAAERDFGRRPVAAPGLRQENRGV